ncbi:alpha/beta superfamily hydrolase [Yarrowia lipolytica]|uniref:Peptidase S9 prolyl oligopeptidase catalytic domain-containing protein n=1 Tax=Yarrowia lipolytica TaxID=4952 RepID=A0A1D8NNB4_YARLL|nr:hypothetical protein YALI1_F17289g [Yarrowia lipolytica]KAB8281281.1 alpha/beta superfamily hydrolase [Yarrowia lipolytica]KAE8170477.1 alpha/beta superfamily hydrolase [Yarrowia lipolytica]KAJ8055777.1 alpha/beta superfamily hydrolase [Yarrowia lipolytica]RMI94306.1 alpha/beta fold family hydrolase [Yarrowia lipolytica]
MSNISIKNNNGNGITLAAVVNKPQNFDESKKYPAVVVTHPGGGVKEQTAGTYAKKLADEGDFVTGASTGEPRQLENPHVRTDDISAVIDYLETQSFVDTGKIGAMGVCAGGGYTANAAINDSRIKAVGTVSAVNIGQMFRNGWDGSVKDADAAPYIKAGSDARTAQAKTGDIGTVPLAPLKKEDAPNEEMVEAWEYYHTPRAEHKNSPGVMTARSLAQIVPYDAYNNAEAFLTQPVLVVYGENAGSKWMSEDLVKRAAAKDKSSHVVKDANHMDLYDKNVDEVASKLSDFFKKHL